MDVDISFKQNFGTFCAIKAPKRIPIHATEINAKKDPNQTSTGRAYLEARVIVKIWVLSPNSIKNIYIKPAIQGLFLNLENFDGKSFLSSEVSFCVSLFEILISSVFRSKQSFLRDHASKNPIMIKEWK